MSISLIIINFLWCRSKVMTNSTVYPNTMLAEVCFNGGKPNKLLKVWVNITLKDLTTRWNQPTTQAWRHKEGGIHLIWTSTIRRRDNNV